MQGILCNLPALLLVSVQILYAFPRKIQGIKKSCDNKEPTESFLWTMKRDPPVYFFGTIHVPYTQVWDNIPINSKRAFRRAENVFFELDLTDAQTLADLARCQMLPRGTNLNEILPSELYQRLKRHLNYVKRAMPDWVVSEQDGNSWYADYLFDAIVGNWERKRPIWVMLMINSLTEADVRSRGIPVLDLYLARQAEKIGKTVGAVEEVDEQCQPFNGLNMSQVLFILNHTLMMQERRRLGNIDASYTTDDLVDQYNCGKLDLTIFEKDSSQILKMTNSSAWLTEENFANERDESELIMEAEIDSYFKSELINRRNRRMAERVRSLLEDKPNQSFFFAFGAGHFLGNGSVIDFLEESGYEIENTPPDNSQTWQLDDLPHDGTSLLKKFLPGKFSLSNSRNKSKHTRKRHPRRRRKPRRRHKKKRKEHKSAKTNPRVRNLWIPLTPEEISQKKSSRSLAISRHFGQTSSLSVIDRHLPTLSPYSGQDSQAKVYSSALDKSLQNIPWWTSNGKQREEFASGRLSLPLRKRQSTDPGSLQRLIWAKTKSEKPSNGAQSVYRTNLKAYGRMYMRLTYFIIASVSILIMHLNTTGTTTSVNQANVHRVANLLPTLEPSGCGSELKLPTPVVCTKLKLSAHHIMRCLETSLTCSMSYLLLLKRDWFTLFHIFLRRR